MRHQAAILAVALLAVAGIGGAGASNAAGTKTTDISFDGFCDGMQVTVFSWHQAGTAHTGCETGVVGAGMEGKVKGASWSGKTLTIGENPNFSGEIYLWNIQYPIVSGAGWSLYSTTDGVNFGFINSGTYTVTGAADHSPRVGPPSDLRARK
jgi:hypothetical protein